MTMKKETKNGTPDILLEVRMTGLQRTMLLVAIEEAKNWNKAQCEDYINNHPDEADGVRAATEGVINTLDEAALNLHAATELGWTNMIDSVESRLRSDEQDL